MAIGPRDDPEREGGRGVGTLRTPLQTGNLRSSRVGFSESVLSGSAVISDAACLLLSGSLIYLLYVTERLVDLRDSEYAAAVAIVTMATLLGFHGSGLYRFERIVHAASATRPVVLVLSAVFLAGIACAFALKISESYSRVWVFSWLLGAAISVLSVRAALAAGIRYLARQGLIGRNIVIYGAGAQGMALIRHIESRSEPWNHVVAVFDDRMTRIRTSELGFPTSGRLEDMVRWARAGRVDEILIALPWGAGERLQQITRMLSVLPSDVRLSPEFIAADFRRNPMTHEYGMPMLVLLNRPVSGWSAIIKKLLDMSLAAVALLFALPVMALIALLIRLDSPGPVLFRQKRFGFNQKLFDMYKFRTMRHDAHDANASRLTIRDDPRVTRIGAFLRRFSLDELPQLFNVLKGEMAIVGPRPHALEAKAGDKLYDQVVDQYAARHRVKPGITGWAQVNGWRGNTVTEGDILGRVEHDIYYIENWSVWLDFWILMLTVSAVVRGENSY